MALSVVWINQRRVQFGCRYGVIACPDIALFPSTEPQRYARPPATDRARRYPQAVGHGKDRHRRHRLAPRVRGVGHAHDTGPGFLLWRARPPEERARDDHAQLLLPRAHPRAVGPVGGLAGLRAGPWRSHRWTRLADIEGSRPGPEPGLRRDGPSA